MLTNLSADHVLATLVDCLLPRHTTDRGLYIRLRISVSHYSEDGEDDRNETRYLHFVVDRPTNYTKIFCAIGSHNLPTLDRFKMQSDHDSCWRSDGFRCVDRAVGEMEEAIGLRARDLSIYTAIDGVFQCKLTWERTEGDHYLKHLTSLTLGGKCGR